jgi:hypothetical protein
MVVVGCIVAAALVSLSIAAGDPAATAGTTLAGGALGTLIAGLGLRRAGWLGGGGRIRHLTWLSEGGWLLRDAAGRRWSGSLRGQTRVAGGWVWLSWRLDNRRARSLLLVPGDISSEELRRLVVRLRIEGAAGPRPGRPAFPAVLAC